MPTPEELKDALVSDTRNILDVKSKIAIPMEDAKVPTIDEESLSKHLVETLINDDKDKIGINWAQKRIEDIKYYYQVKDRFMAMWPWPNASNFPVPVIPVMLDVGHTALTENSDIPKKLKIKGYGIEDRRVAPYREKILKAQLRDYIDTDYVIDYNTFQALLHGTSYIKVVRKPPVTRFTVDMVVVPIKDIYLPIDSSGPEVGKCEHVTHIVGNSVQDLIIKAQLKDSKGHNIFKNVDKITPGWSIGSLTNQKDITGMYDIVYGTDLTGKINRDTYFWAETYITWYHSAGARPMELVVWWAPSTGEILHWNLNEDGIRPFADTFLYPDYGRAFHRSLPEILKNVQDKANYTDKQITDSSDIAISPGTFIPEGEKFMPGRYQRVPSGIFGIPIGTTVQFEQPNISPILERKGEREDIWNLAGNLSGFTEPLQGILPSRSITATTDVLRDRASKSRLGRIIRRYNRGLRKAVKLVDFYVERYMPRKMAIKLIGVEEVNNINEIYPYADEFNGDNDRMIPGFSLDYYIPGTTLIEFEQEKQDRITFYTNILNHDIFGRDLGNAYRSLKEISEAMDIDNFEEVVHKPDEAKILSPEQLINRIMSGQLDVQPSTLIDAVKYQTAVKEFTRTIAFKNASEEQKHAFSILFARLETIRMFAEVGRQDFQMNQLLDLFINSQQSVGNGKESKPAGVLSNV